MADITIGDLLISLGADASDTSEFLQVLAEVKQRMLDTDAATKQAGASIDDWGEIAQGAASSIQSVAAASQQAAQGANALGAAAQNAAGGLSAAAAAATGLGTAAQTASAATAAAGAGLTSTNDAAGALAAGFAGLGTSIDNTANSIERVAQRLIIRDTLIALATDIKNTAGAFDESAAQITGATGAIGSSLDDYNAALTQALSETVGKATDIGHAMGQISSAFDLSPDDSSLVALTQSIVDLAKITGTAAGTITTDVIAMARAWNISPDQLTSGLQDLLAVSQAYDISYSKLLTDLTKSQPTFDALGVSVGSAAQFIGQLTADGLNASQVMTALNSEMDKLAKQGSTDVATDLGKAIEIIKSAKTPTEELGLAALAFGNQAAPAMVKGINDGTISLQNMRAPLEATTTDIKDQANSMTTLADEWQRFQTLLASGSVGTTATIVGKALIDAATASLSGWNDLGNIIQGVGIRLAEVAALAVTFANPSTGWASLKTIRDQASADIAALHIQQANYDQMLKNAVAGIPAANTASGSSVTLGASVLGAGTGAGPGATVSGSSVTLPGIPAGTPSAAATGTGAGSGSGTPDLAAIWATLGVKPPTDKLPTDPLYQLIARQVQLLQRDMAGKNSIGALTAEQGVLLDIKINDPSLLSLNQELAQVDQVVKTQQQYHQPVGEALQALQTQLNYQLQSSGMDNINAEKLLGLPDPATVQNQIALITQAYGQLTTMATATPGYLAIAWDQAQQKILADTRSIGGQVSDAMVLNADWAKTIDQIANMDLGTARQQLGLTTTDQVLQSLAKDSAAYQTVLQSVANGTASLTDAQNAEIDMLTKDKAALAASGQALSDVNQARLDYLNTQKQLDSMNAESALSMFGISSEDDLTNAINLIEGAYQKVKDAETAQTVQLSSTAQLSLALKEITDEMTAFGKAGEAVTDAMVQKFMDLTQAVSLSAVNLQNSLSALSVMPVDQANQAIDTVKAELDKIGEYYGTSSNEYEQALVSANAKITTLLQQSGQSVASSLTQDADQAKANIASMVMTIDQAYQTLNITSSGSAAIQLQTMSTAYFQIAADATSTSKQMNDARLAYDQAYYKDAIALGQDFSSKNYALMQVELQQQKDTANQVDNAWNNAMKSIQQGWQSLSNDMASGIDGLIEHTTTLTAAFEKMGEDIFAIITKYILNQLIFTQANLTSLQTSLLKLFGAVPGAVAPAAIASGTQALIAPSIASAIPTLSDSSASAIQAASQQLAQAGTQAAQDLTSGGSSILSSITGAGTVWEGSINSSMTEFGSQVDGISGTFTDAISTGASDFTTAAGQVAGDMGQAAQSATQAATSASQAASSAAGAASAGASSFSSILSMAGSIGSIVGAVAGIIGDIQNVHIENVLGEIEQNTRAANITLGGTGSADGISAWTKTIGQKVTAINDWNNGTLQQYLQNINGDLDVLSGGSGVSGISAGDSAIVGEIMSVGTTLSGELQLILQALETGVSPLHGGTSSNSTGSAPSTTAPAATAPGPVSSSYRRSSAAPNAYTDIPSISSSLVTGAGLSTVPDYPNYEQAPNIPAGSGQTTVGPAAGTTPENPSLESSGPLGAPLVSISAAATPAQIASAIQNALTQNYVPNPQTNNFLAQQGESIDALLASLDTSNVTGLGQGGFTLGGVNTATGQQLTQAQFDQYFSSVAQQILGGSVSRAGTPANNGQYSSDQISAIDADFLAQMQDYFTNQFAPNIAGELAQIVGPIITTVVGGEGAGAGSALIGTGSGGAAGTLGTPVGIVAAAGTSSFGIGGASGGSGGIVSVSAVLPSVAAGIANAAAAAAAAANAWQGIAGTKPGYGVGLPTAAISASQIVQAGTLSGIDVNNPPAGYGNTINARPVQISINGNNFPTGMTPTQVANSLMDLIRTQTALLR